MNKLIKYYQILKLLGPSWAFFRLQYAWQSRGDFWEKKTPRGKWGNKVSFLKGRFWKIKWTSDHLDQAMDINAGKYRLFFKHDISTALKPDWFAIYFAANKVGEIPQKNVHWSRISDFSSGDIKGVWELSRFAWAYPLIQANDSETFWRLVQEWAASNPPNTGVHWKCGQEVAIRMFSLTAGYFAFEGDRSTTRKRKDLCREIIFRSAVRIDANIEYALSQKNNHGISEAAGLFTVGILFDHGPWRDKGKALLESQARELIYDDGSFSQHSVNYHRLMLHVYLWAIQLGKANAVAFSETMLHRVRKAGLWLLALCDPESGRCPNLGANDGALIFPVTTSDYLDFRPTIQAVAAVIDKEQWLPFGPWDALTDFLGAGDTLGKAIKSHQGSKDVQEQTASTPQRPETTWKPTPASEIQYLSGGYAVFTPFSSTTTRLIFRCPTSFKHRPGHCDLLHVDLFHQGINVLRDAGSFSYNCEQPWQSYFSSVAAHNTIQFDEHEQMPRLSRFLLGKWPKSKVVVDEVNGQICASFNDWKGCGHERTIQVREKGFVVIDRFRGFEKKAVLRWRLAPELDWVLEGSACKSQTVELKISTDNRPDSIKLVSGWESLYYQERTSLSVLEVEVGDGCRELITEIGVL